MTDHPEVPTFSTAADFFAQALAIEVEASERYTMLADTMEVHNNREVAEIFRKMAHIESLHRDEIARRAEGANVGDLPVRFSWLGPDGPEATDLHDTHYLMSAHHALLLARHNEQRAAAYFAAIAATSSDPDIRAFAQEMADDEAEHVKWVDEWLKKFPPPPEGWHEDPDPPVFSD